MKGFIVDDQKDVVDNLLLKLGKHSPEIDVVGYAHNVEDAYTSIMRLKPDLVFLDIDLGKENSFSLLDLFSKIDFKIIFITGHNDFAIKAIRYSAMDYILKPVNVIELVQAIERVKQKLTDEKSIDFLKEQIKTNNHAPEKIILNSGGKSYVVKINDIVYCEVEDNHLTIYFASQAHLKVSMQLKQIEDLLPSSFLKSHRSYLVNKNHVLKIDRVDSVIFMDNGEELPLSSSRKADFLKLMGMDN